MPSPVQWAPLVVGRVSRDGSVSTVFQGSNFRQASSTEKSRESFVKSAPKPPTKGKGGGGGRGRGNSGLIPGYKGVNSGV